MRKTTVRFDGISNNKIFLKKHQQYENIMEKPEKCLKNVHFIPLTERLKSEATHETIQHRLLVERIISIIAHLICSHLNKL